MPSLSHLLFLMFLSFFGEMSVSIKGHISLVLLMFFFSTSLPPTNFSFVCVKWSVLPCSFQRHFSGDRVLCSLLFSSIVFLFCFVCCFPIFNVKHILFCCCCSLCLFLTVYKTVSLALVLVCLQWETAPWHNACTWTRPRVQLPAQQSGEVQKQNMILYVVETPTTQACGK